MHPREKILGLMKLHQLREEPIPEDLKAEAIKWNVKIPGAVETINQHNKTTKERQHDD